MFHVIWIGGVLIIKYTRNVIISYDTRNVIISYEIDRLNQMLIMTKLKKYTGYHPWLFIWKIFFPMRSL